MGICDRIVAFKRASPEIIVSPKEFNWLARRLEVQGFIPDYGFRVSEPVCVHIITQEGDLEEHARVSWSCFKKNPDQMEATAQEEFYRASLTDQAALYFAIDHEEYAGYFRAYAALSGNEDEVLFEDVLRTASRSASCVPREHDARFKPAVLLTFLELGFIDNGYLQMLDSHESHFEFRRLCVHKLGAQQKFKRALPEPFYRGRKPSSPRFGAVCGLLDDVVLDHYRQNCAWPLQAELARGCVSSGYRGR